MTAECSRCGDCCENIWFSATKTALARDLKRGNMNESNAYGARFVLKHWHSIGNAPEGYVNRQRHLFRCDMFDSDTRLCTAHDARPPVCSGFPYYGKDPGPDGGLDIKVLPDRCSFRGDWEPVMLMPTSTE